MDNTAPKETHVAAPADPLTQTTQVMKAEKPHRPTPPLRLLFIIYGAIIIIVTTALFINQVLQTPTPPKLRAGMAIPVTSAPSKVVSKDRTFEIRGSTLVEIDGYTTRTLFTNLEDVTAVRLGPDGATLHFKVSKTLNANGFVNRNRCAYLNTKVDPLPSRTPDSPPQSPPWDYRKINYGYTIQGCGDSGDASGYLSSNKFAYLRVKDSDMEIVVEDLAAKQVARIPLPSTIAQKLAAELNYEANPTRELAAYQGSDKSWYVYSSKSADVGQNKLVIAFGHYVFGVALSSQSFLGSLDMNDKAYEVVANAYSFFSDGELPVAVVESGWEGVSRLQAVLDLSGSTMKVLPLISVATSNFSFYSAEQVTWQKDKVILHFYKSKDLTRDEVKSLIGDDLSKFDNNSDPDEAEIAKEEKDYGDRLKKAGNFIDAVCLLSPGMFGVGCYALTEDFAYGYTPGSGKLVKE